MESHANKVEKKLLLEDSFWIYTEGMSIDYDDIESLLKQPREKVIHDMEVLIKDAIENASLYKEAFSHPASYAIVEDDFVTTALLILGDLEAEESLPLMFKAFSMDQEWIDLFIFTEYGEILWDIVVNLGKNKLDMIYDFVMDPRTSTWVRAVLSEGLEQLALNFPDYREQVIEVKERIIKHYTSGKVEKTEETIDHTGMTVWSLLNLGSVESLPLFKKVFELGMIEKNLVGNYSMAEESTRANKENNSEGLKREIMTFADRHAWFWETIGEEVDALRPYDDDIYDDMDDYGEEDDEEFDKYMEEIGRSDLSDYHNTKYDHLKVSKQELPRRNDPCPCGSGRKYKNCCMLKDLYPGALN